MPPPSAASSSQQQPAPRGNGSLCIGLLIVAICMQIYVISLWMTPARSDKTLEDGRTGVFAHPLTLPAVCCAVLRFGSVRRSRFMWSHTLTPIAARCL